MARRATTHLLYIAGSWRPTARRPPARPATDRTVGAPAPRSRAGGRRGCRWPAAPRAPSARASRARAAPTARRCGRSCAQRKPGRTDGQGRAGEHAKARRGGEAQSGAHPSCAKVERVRRNVPLLPPLLSGLELGSPCHHSWPRTGAHQQQRRAPGSGGGRRSHHEFDSILQARRRDAGMRAPLRRPRRGPRPHHRNDVRNHHRHHHRHSSRGCGLPFGGAHHLHGRIRAALPS